MSDWDRANKAPKDKFRVIGTDTFSWPHENYWVGDYADLAQAKLSAASRASNGVHLRL